MWRPPRPAASTVLLLVIAISACGAGRPMLDTDEVERALETSVVSDPAVEVGRADCPGEVERQVGGTFDCTLGLDGQVLTVTVRQTDDEGTVELEPQQLVLLRREVEAEVARRVADESAAAPDDPRTGETTASCGDRAVLVTVPGDRLPCTVARGAHAVVTVEVEVGEEGALVIRPRA